MVIIGGFKMEENYINESYDKNNLGGN